MMGRQGQLRARRLVPQFTAAVVAGARGFSGGALDGARPRPPPPAHPARIQQCDCETRARGARRTRRAWAAAD